MDFDGRRSYRRESVAAYSRVSFAHAWCEASRRHGGSTRTGERGTDPCVAWRDHRAESKRHRAPRGRLLWHSRSGISTADRLSCQVEMRCQLRAILSEGSSDHDYRVRHNHHTSKHSMSTTSLMSPQQRPHRRLRNSRRAYDVVGEGAY